MADTVGIVGAAGGADAPGIYGVVSPLSAELGV